MSACSIQLFLLRSSKKQHQETHGPHQARVAMVRGPAGARVGRGRNREGEARTPNQKQVINKDEEQEEHEDHHQPPTAAGHATWCQGLHLNLPRGMPVAKNVRYCSPSQENKPPHYPSREAPNRRQEPCQYIPHPTLLGKDMLANLRKTNALFILITPNAFHQKKVNFVRKLPEPIILVHLQEIGFHAN